ncbi:ATP-binding protein [Brachybacterium sp. J144]|uniref:ATP-binding protein n=1 Tax=Brachybacterium sp. J144 TaxID=3116487 RepID=UPI002E7A38C2|nr:ATP-binding protein [Brachybacterium sp. J144]MEE1649559.1 ATP-binding protein [Brachybacterium sp. J144]
MWQRVLQATLITVVLSVLLLGIPLGWSWLNLNRQELYSEANRILDTVRIDTEERLSEDRPIDEAMLQQRVDEQLDLNIAIEVKVDDLTVRAGDPPGEGAIEVRTLGTNGQEITVFIPQSDVRAHTASAWVLIAVAALSALSIGVSVALWQAQRISMPLARLSRRAEEMGGGRARGPWKPSGISEIDDVAEELARSGAMLTERLEAESRLASDASHQLRTPLTALSMRLDEILATSSEEWVREEARISLEQIDRLTEVVHDLINAPRSSQRRTPGVVELRTVLTQQSEEWSPAYRRAGRELRIQVPRTAAVWGSQGPLTQVIATLIENALAHGGGRTLVKVRRNDHSTVIEVSDEGRGIDPELGSRIFERSVSGRSSTGTGVGLALARTLVEDDGGRLELLTESPATFGVFLISAPGDEPDLGGDEDGGELGRLPQGSVVRRRSRGRTVRTPAGQDPHAT